MRRVQTQQQLDQRGLATAVFADDEHDIALFDAQIDRAEMKGVAALDRRVVIAQVVQFQGLHIGQRIGAVADQQVGFGVGKLPRQFGDTAHGDLRAADAGQGCDQAFQRAFHVQHHQHEAAQHGFFSGRPHGLEGDGDADHGKEQHRTEGFRADENIGGANVRAADVLGGTVNLFVEHVLATLALNAQLLGTRRQRLIVLLQFVFAVARRQNATHAVRMGQVLRAGAEHHGEHGQRQNLPGQQCQIGQAAQGDGERDDHRCDRQGEGADGVDVVEQHRNQTVRAITLQLLDGCHQHLGSQLTAQVGDHALANVVGRQVGQCRAGQGQHTQPGKQQRGLRVRAAGHVHRVVDGGQQAGDAQTADNTQHGRQRHQPPEGLEDSQGFPGEAFSFAGHGVSRQCP
ncbi:Unknown protein sequence [Pseudomonas amygdali pv. eriobotryae]|uniref:Uncharacterized protein n=1 Tax=Pseudomonas amygdali pv. eriobotryae TaxID=129137 RepID=A0A0P9RV66_PSEA0|nr:Unknown protein sequence [Pseudomonas amygdali pv. eriobotryae]